MRQRSLDHPFTSKEEVVSSIAMTLLLIILAMLFVTFFLGLSVYRLNNPIWPPAGFVKVSLGLPLTSTVIIILSSLTYHFFLRSFQRNIRDGWKKNFYFLTLFLGLCFMSAQFLFWKSLSTQGLLVEGGLYPSLLYTFTWIHAFHVVLALIILLSVYPASGELEEESVQIYKVRVLNVGKFWHFLGIVWILIFLFLFIL